MGQTDPHSGAPEEEEKDAPVDVDTVGPDTVAVDVEPPAPDVVGSTDPHEINKLTRMR